MRAGCTLESLKLTNPAHQLRYEEDQFFKTSPVEYTYLYN